LAGPAVGAVVAGRYELTGFLTKGGMGSLWRARDLTLDRVVVLKTLLDESAGDDALVGRLRREARAMAGLDHPGIPAVHDLCEDGGRVWLVMQYVEGPDARDHLAEQGPLPYPAVAAVAAQVASALAAAHAAGITHRDLKPANVVVGADGLVRVVDFGLAHLAGAASRLTMTGEILGTAEYMSPELAAGRPVGPASDLYQLGCVIHALVTGGPPFTGGRLVTVMNRHVNEVPRPLRARRPDVPEELEALTARLLAKDPADRPRDAVEVYECLRPLLPPPDAGPLDASPVEDPRRPFRFPAAPSPAAARRPA
jgi:serine/threonine protein kinase